MAESREDVEKMDLRKLILPLLFLIFSQAGLAEETPDVIHDLSGNWRSSTGVAITIPPYEIRKAPGGFVFRVKLAGGKTRQYKATWRTGFRQGFTYRTPDGEEIFAVVDREGEQISLSNKDASWKATWFRKKR